MSDVLRNLIDEVVVLDTSTPILYIGRLMDINDLAFVLADADMHDCRDGHANREHYLAEAHRDGIAVNRRTVIVMRSYVISVSRLADVVMD